MKLGELMVRQGLLTEAQVAEVLAAQARRTEPFGSICERLFGIAPELVEGAWVEQYSVLTEGLTPDFSRQDPSVLNVVTRRQAWQFRIVPVCWDEGSLVRDQSDCLSGLLPLDRLGDDGGSAEFVVPDAGNGRGGGSGRT